MADQNTIDGIGARLTKNDGTFANLAHHIDLAPSLQSDATTADSDKTFTVPAGKQWTVQAIRIELTTVSSTAVAGSTSNRQLEVQFRSTADDVIFSSVPNAPAPQNVTRYYDLAPEYPDTTGFRDTDKAIGTIPRLTLPSGFDIRIFDNKTRHTTADDMVVHLSVLERDNLST